MSTRDEEIFVHAAGCVHGKVLIGGLACGNTIREAVYGADWVDQMEASEDDPVRLEALPDPDPVPDPVVETGVVERIQQALDDDEDWDTVVLDVDDAVVEADASIQTNLADFFPAIGGRVVVVTRNRNHSITGFRSTVVREGDDFCVVVHERWDPANGIGTDSYAGKVRRTAVGWVPAGASRSGPTRYVLTLDGDVLQLDGETLTQEV